MICIFKKIKNVSSRKSDALKGFIVNFDDFFAYIAIFERVKLAILPVFEKTNFIFCYNWIYKIINLSYLKSSDLDHCRNSPFFSNFFTITQTLEFTPKYTITFEYDCSDIK